MRIMGIEFDRAGRVAVAAGLMLALAASGCIKVENEAPAGGSTAGGVDAARITAAAAGELADHGPDL